MMFMLVLAFGVSMSAIAEEKKIYLIDKDESQEIDRQLIGIAEGKDNSPVVGSLDMNLLGACTAEGKCERTINLDQRMNDAFARSNGITELPERMRIKTGMIYPVETESEFKSNTTLETTASMLGHKTTKTYSLTQTGLSIEFSETATGGNRFDYKEATPEQQKLAAGVFQIHSDIEDDGLSGNSRGHGTGFFISEDGYAMTNLHVMRDRPDCLRQGNCKIPITTRQESRSTTEVEATVLTCNRAQDFCLIKIDTKDLGDFHHFNLNEKTISSNLISLGFAGDRTEEVGNEEDGSEEACLTYTQGTSLGISGTGITSSLRISGGASGSPVIDELTSDVVGILSNGAQINDGKSGMPGIFRPISFIESDFELSKYLDGSKQIKIDAILDRLETANSAIEGNKIISDFEKEKSYYGIERIQDIAVNHQSSEVRRTIMNYIRRRVQRI